MTPALRVGGRGWRDGSAVKSTGYLCRGPRFDSQLTHPLVPEPGDQCPLAYSGTAYVHVVYLHAEERERFFCISLGD